MEVAALGLRVDGVEGIDRAAASLDGLAAAGVKAEKSTQGVGRGSASAKPSVDSLAASAEKAAQAEAKLAAQADRAGMSVNQLKNAIRGVPAQFTDIAVSIQGGMSPLTVFLQQGGQLKDMFGGAGNAARALGVYVAGLVNPFTVAAAGAAALGVAYYQGSKEQDAFMVSMANTGNAAGETTSSLRAYSQQISSTVGTQGKAAESLNIFIDSGVRAGASLARLTQTAIAWEKATGEGVDKVAEKYVALQKDPLKAALKLNEGMNFLTLSVYEQVKSLEKQGKTTDAAKAAMDALDSAMSERSKTIEQNLGSIQRGWNGITGAAKTAWDAMLNIGRPASLNDQLLDVEKRLEGLMGQQGFGETEGGAATGRVSAGQQAKIKESIRLLQEQKAALMGQAEAERWSADATKKNGDAVATKAAWDKIVTANASKQEKMEIALANVRQRAADAGITGKALEAQLSAEREKYADKTNKSTAAVTAAKTAYESLIVSINEKISATNSELASGDKQTEADKLRARYQQELTTRSRQFTEAQKKKIEADIEAYDVLEKQLKAARELEKAWADDEKALESYTKKQDDYLRSVSDSVAKMQEEEAGHVLAAQAGISHAQAMQKLTIARLEDARAQMQQGAGSAEEVERINQEIEARKKLLGVIQSGDARKETEKATEDAAKAWQKSLDDAQKAAEKTSQMIGDTLSDYIMGGGKDAATYLKRLFANLVLQPLVQTTVSSFLGVGSAAGGSSGVGGAMSAVSNISTAYGALTGGITKTLGGAIGKLGETFGSSALTSFSNGMTGKTIASNMIGPSASAPGAASAAGATFAKALPVVGWIATGMMAAKSAYDEGYTEKDLNWANPIGLVEKSMTRVLSALGISDKTAHILTGASLTAKIFDKVGLLSTPHTGAGAIYSAGDIQEGAGIYNKASFGMGVPEEYSASAQSAVSSLAVSAGVALDAIAKTFGLGTGYSVSTSFADDRSKDGAWGSLKIADELGNILVNWADTQAREGVPREFADGKEGAEQYMEAAGEGVLSAIQAMNLPGWAKDIFKVAEGAEGLQSAMLEVSSAMSTFRLLAETMTMFSGIAGDMQTRLFNAAGGIEALTASASDFYQGFYTEGERAQKQREQQMAALGGMGLYIDPYQGDAAKEAFRKTVEEAMASGQAEMAAQLLAMSAAFAATAEYGQTLFDESAKAAEDAIEKAKVAAAESVALADSWTGLGQVMAMFSGITAEMQARLLGAAGSMDALSSGAQDFSQNFYSDDERMLRQRATQMSALAGMGLYIDPAEGDKAKELFRKTVEEAMSSGQAELAVKLQAMSGAFAEAADYAAGLAESVANERYSLESSYLSLIGDTAQLRARELATLSESNQELQKLIWTRQDEASAAAAMQGVSQSFSGLRETITLDQLGTDDAKYGYFKAQADSLTRMLPQLQDQEAITRAVSQIQSFTSRAYGTLDEAQKLEMGDEFLQYLSKTEDLALKNIERTNKEQADATGKAVGDAVAKEVGRIVDAITRLATDSGELSRETVEAIRRLASQTGGSVAGTTKPYAEVNA